MDAVIITDVHGNLEALTTVLTDIKVRYGGLPILCLGDMVDYGPRPQECVDLVRKNCFLTLLGNHEYNLIDGGKHDKINGWTAQVLNGATIEWFQGLSTSFEDPCDNAFIAAHGCPAKGQDWKAVYKHTNVYLMSDNPLWDHVRQEALGYMQELGCNLAFVGHSHKAFLWHDGTEVPGTKSLTHEVQGPVLISVPSVGQPRDGNTMTGYVIVRQERNRKILDLHRLEYDVQKTIADLHARNCPFADKLAHGLQIGRYH